MLQMRAFFIPDNFFHKQHKQVEICRKLTHLTSTSNSKHKFTIHAYSSKNIKYYYTEESSKTFCSN